MVSAARVSRRGDDTLLFVLMVIVHVTSKLGTRGRARVVRPLNLNVVVSSVAVRSRLANARASTLLSLINTVGKKKDEINIKKWRFGVSLLTTLLVHHP